MSLPLNWLVLFFFIILAIIFFVVYEINSKFKWRERAFELEDKVQNLKNQLSAAANLRQELSEVLENVRKNLTQRQLQIFIYTIEGLSSKEISEKLNLSTRTVDSHIKEIFAKLDVEKRSQFTKIFFDNLGAKIGIQSLTDL